MLLRLSIRDFIIVDTLELEFGAGFGALTGETGAGKSILIDALSFVLGERAESGLVRPGRERADITAEFDLTALPQVGEALAAQDIEADGTLLLRRVIDAGGRSRAYLNGTPATLQQLREVSDQLVDIHGQHAHQSLLRAEVQREMLDAYGGHTAIARETEARWRVWRDAEIAHRSALAGGEALLREREQLSWELGELEALAFTADEWAALNDEQRRLANASGLVEGAQFAVDALAEGDASCAVQLSAVTQRIEGLVEFDSRLDEMLALLRSAATEVGEAAADFRRYADRLEVDPGRLAEVDRRIDAILAAARKYRVAAEDLPDALQARRGRLAQLAETADPEALAAGAAKAREAYTTTAGKLTQARLKTAKLLSQRVSERLQELALAGGRFEVALLPLDEGAASGLEKIEFRVGGLAGDETRPLAKAASGGELSRISLALQVVASQAARVPTLIFDEVDVGIGGGVAEVVGRLLRTLGMQRQVLCVTHLPQVAAQANVQWRVAKQKTADGVCSEVESLDASSRVEEIARMLGGMEITAVTRQHAREMLGV
jgi:DNA repair protein RecN (Recombination protein N)